MGMIFQYAMYDGEARETLTGDLTHFYKEGRFELEGVEVIGAGTAEVNGCYCQRKASEGPPAGWTYYTREQWIVTTGDYPWFEKDDCYIHFDFAFGRWLLGLGTKNYYEAKSYAGPSVRSEELCTERWQRLHRRIRLPV